MTDAQEDMVSKSSHEGELRFIIWAVDFWNQNVVQNFPILSKNVVQVTVKWDLGLL